MKPRHYLILVFIAETLSLQLSEGGSRSTEMWRQNENNAKIIEKMLQLVMKFRTGNRNIETGKGIIRTGNRHILT